MTFLEILKKLNNAVIRLDVGISTRVFTPVAAVLNYRFGMNQWAAAEQALMGSGVLGIVYFGLTSVLQSPWYGLFGIFIPWWYIRYEHPRIKRYSRSELGPLTALVNEHFSRMWFLGAILGSLYNAVWGSQKFHLYDLLGNAHLFLLLCSYYFRTVMMPPPKQREQQFNVRATAS